MKARVHLQVCWRLARLESLGHSELIDRKSKTSIIYLSVLSFRHDIEAHDLFMNLGRNISKGLRPVLIVLRSLGYFPGFVLSQKRQQRTLRIVSFF